MLPRGYSWLALAILLIYVFPLVTFGARRLMRRQLQASATSLARVRIEPTREVWQTR